MPFPSSRYPSAVSSATDFEAACWLAVPVGSIPAGGTMRARLGIFFTFRDGLIATQHNYDCFDPF
jgi:hypothetical protein